MHIENSCMHTNRAEYLLQLHAMDDKNAMEDANRLAVAFEEEERSDFGIFDTRVTRSAGNIWVKRGPARAKSFLLPKMAIWAE